MISFRAQLGGALGIVLGAAAGVPESDSEGRLLKQPLTALERVRAAA